MFNLQFAMISMFAAALILERDAPGGFDFLGALTNWVQIVGAFAAVGIVLWGLIYGPRRSPLDRGTPAPPWLPQVLLGALILAGIAYAVYGAFKLPQLFESLVTPPDPTTATAAKTVAPVNPTAEATQEIALTVGGACALLVVLIPVALNLPAWRGRRIWALTKLAFLEAVRRRVLWIFAFLLIPFLFPATWWSEVKSENEVRITVNTAFFVMTLLLGTAAALLAAFGLPTDIRSASIHTVVTKPVERFEITLGRFLGYAGLVTLMLAGMTLLSLFFILATGVSAEAAEESFKARKPFKGYELRFQGVRDEARGENVGREFEYRGYISGPVPQQPDQFAVWNFRDLPAKLAQRDWNQCEFTFDIYRTTKGEENKGVACSFFFETPQWHEARLSEYKKDLADALKAGRSSEDEIKRELAKKYGYYEVISKRIEDYHTGSVQVPGTLFEAAPQATVSPGDPRPPLRVRVRCDSRTQYIGMARNDLYFRLDDPTAGADKLLFAVNFAKGAFGIWCQLMLIIGLAVACSTYLSGVISLLAVVFLYVCGLFREFLQTVVEGKNFGGGPMESALRLFNPTVAAQGVEAAGAQQTVSFVDDPFRLGMRFFFSLIPDLDRFSLAPDVASGFDIPLSYLLVSVSGCLPYLLAYLVPWMILTFYAIRSREIAGNF
jgi:hypothetical protein